jgi:hypothetical protein
MITSDNKPSVKENQHQKQNFLHRVKMIKDVVSIKAFNFNKFVTSIF